MVLYQLAKYKSEAKPQWKNISKPHKSIRRKTSRRYFLFVVFLER
ncbi:MAG: hypothetical protein QXV47_06695 [Fervidicoccaceae archaeon]